jgi:hypothetical protein
LLAKARAGQIFAHLVHGFILERHVEAGVLDALGEVLEARNVLRLNAIRNIGKDFVLRASYDVLDEVLSQ